MCYQNKKKQKNLFKYKKIKFKYIEKKNFAKKKTTKTVHVY